MSSVRFAGVSVSVGVPDSAPSLESGVCDGDGDGFVSVGADGLVDRPGSLFVPPSEHPDSDTTPAERRARN